MKGGGANGLRPAAAAAARSCGGAPAATAFRVQPSRATLPSRDGAGERRAVPALTATGCGRRMESRASSGRGYFWTGGCRQCGSPDPAALGGVGVVITGRHVGGLLAIVARVKPIAVIVAVESSRHSFRRRFPGWAATAGTGVPAGNLAAASTHGPEPTGTTEWRMGTSPAVARRIAKRLPSPSANDPPQTPAADPWRPARKAAANASRAARRKAPGGPSRPPAQSPPEPASPHGGNRVRGTACSRRRTADRAR